MVTMATPTDTAPRQRYARGEGDRLRLDLLNAAADLMATHGTLEGISLRAVAREAGVSPTAVYRHFDDHTTLLRESVELCWNNFLRVMREAQESSDDPFIAFENAGGAYIRFAMDHRGQYRVLFSNPIHLDMGAPVPAASMEASTTDSAGMSAFQILVDLVGAMLRSSRDDRDAFFVAVQVQTWIHGIVDLCGCHPDAPWPPIQDMLDGLRDALRLTPPDAR
jgi:AcrR family transcriptional regulator